MIDEKIVEQARNADMIDFFENRCGFTFGYRNSAYRCHQHPSLAVKNDRLSWFWHSKGIGGYGALDYLVKVEKMPFPEAMEAMSGIVRKEHDSREEAESPKKLILPEKTGIPLRLYEYLCRTRGIDSEVVGTLIQKKMLYEDKRGNIVFVGFDGRGKARFASLRGTYGDCRFRMDCAGSDKRYGFHTAVDAVSNCLYIFESPIDAMSHASLAITEFGDKSAWEYDYRLSLAGTSDTAIPFFLNQHKAINELVFCLDNDQAGREASGVLAQKYSDKGFRTQIKLPKGKDYNEDLQAITAEKERQRRMNLRQRGVNI